MPQYFLLLRGDKQAVRGHEGPEETQKVIEAIVAWQGAA